MPKTLITTDITASAKMPIRKMTLDHLQQAYNEQFTAIARNIGTDDSGATTAKDILFGLTYTIVSTTFTGTAGAVYTGGKIYYVDATTFTIGAGEYPILVLSTTYATGDPTEFTDGNTYQIHQIQKLAVVSGTTSTTNYVGTLSDFTNKSLPTTVSSGSGITNGANISSGTIYAKRDHLGVVILHGNAQMNGSFATGSSNGVICTLPTTHRPTTSITLICASFKSPSTYERIMIRIDSSTGVVYCIADPASQIANNSVIYLDNITFYAV